MLDVPLYRNKIILSQQPVHSMLTTMMLQTTLIFSVMANLQDLTWLLQKNEVIFHYFILPDAAFKFRHIIFGQLFV